MNGIRAALAAAGLLCVPGAFAGSINFETGAPNQFILATELTTLYAGQGVTFSGPSPGNGGAILDQSAHLGVNAHSGVDFLAFNLLASLNGGGTPAGPETISFSSPVSDVTLWIGGTNTGPVYTLSAFDSSSHFIDNAATQPAGGQWQFLTLNDSNISSLVLSFTSNTAVIDDLSWNGSVSAAPEPSTAVPLGLCFVAIAGTIALRSRRC